MKVLFAKIAEIGVVCVDASGRLGDHLDGFVDIGRSFRVHEGHDSNATTPVTSIEFQSDCDR